MDYFVLDTETFYDSKNGYTLRKQTTEEYINDPRFHCFGFSLSKNGGTPIWVPEDRIKRVLSQIELHKHAVIMHNAQFDAAILNWKYGVKPKLIIDTLAMARAILGNEERLSLEALGERYGIGIKGDAVVHMDGVRNPTPEMAYLLGEYAKNDAVMTWNLWTILKEGFPNLELVVIDITTRMFSEPSFALDEKPVLRELELGEIKKERLLLQANCTMEDLRSDAKFAELLESIGVTPPKKLSAKKTAAAQKKDPAALPVYTWAFAKSDPDFKALGESDNDLVRWAVEARLGLKSTIKQSRSERFLGIARRMGVMPVALTYYGAGTGRYAASSSAKVNMQNLPAIRGSKDPDAGLLRKSLKAPPGKVVVVSDASQIEARLVVWQAGQENVLDAFAQGRDVYSEMASVIFGRHVDRKKNPDDYIPGFLGKCVVLGCLAADTQVLTNNGWKSIVEVNDTDTVWDGEEWVHHSGVINKGEKEVVEAFGLTATMDHEILTERGWREWHEVRTNHSLFQSALSSVALPWSSGHSTTPASADVLAGIRLSNAHVDGSGKLIGRTCSKAEQPVVTRAQKYLVYRLGKGIGGMLTLFPTMRLESGFSTGLPRSYPGVAQNRTNSTVTTAGEVLMCMNSGLMTERSFSNTLSRSTILTRLKEILTGSITMLGTSLGIYASLPKKKMSEIEERSQICNKRLTTYDIAYAGPRNRFTVATTAGPVIVHNCGYGMGHIKFGMTVYGGMLGGPKVLFDDAMVEQLNVNTNEYARYVAKYSDMQERLSESKPASVEAEAWLKHMACAKHIVDRFRENNRAIPEYWKLGDDMLNAMYLGTGEKIGLFKTEKNKLLLPNGMWLHFKELEKDADGFTCMRKKEGRVKRVRVYGGSVVENLSQALAGAYVKEAMVRMHLKGYRPILQVHDEVVVMADENDAENALRVVNECMETVPAWAVGLPLAAEGDFAASYGEAK